MKLDDPDDTHIRRSYEGAPATTTRVSDSPHAFIEPDRQQFMERLPPAAKGLDCGCGPGMDTETFVQPGFTVVAIDLLTGSCNPPTTGPRG